ncbi:MAG: cell division protein ZapA [Pseudomonadota bacterium]
MPELDLDIGGRIYRVVCDPGQEAATQEAAALFSEQAHAVLNAAGQMPESRTLLLAGLLMADKLRMQAGDMASQADRMRAVELRAERAEVEAAKTPEPAVAEPSLFDEQERTAQELLEQIVLELEALAEDLEAVDEG